MQSEHVTASWLLTLSKLHLSLRIDLVHFESHFRYKISVIERVF
jgi:hypothetical protein